MGGGGRYDGRGDGQMLMKGCGVDIMKDHTFYSRLRVGLSIRGRRIVVVVAVVVVAVLFPSTCPPLLLIVSVSPLPHVTTTLSLLW